MNIFSDNHVKRLPTFYAACFPVMELQSSKRWRAAAADPYPLRFHRKRPLTENIDSGVPQFAFIAPVYYL